MNQNDIYIPTDIFISEPAEHYHAKASENLSSHQLIDFMRCPYFHNKKRTGLIKEKESTSYLIGRAAHMRILEGKEEYEGNFAMGGPINPTTDKPYGSLTKKFAEWKEKQGKPVLTFDQMDLIEKMAQGVAMNDHAVDLIYYGIAESVIRADYCGIPCQIRSDWLNPNRGIVDLKTCDDLTWFESDARRYKYANQMAFYQAVMEEGINLESHGLLRNPNGNHYNPVHIPVYLIAIEKKEPFRCGVWRVSDDCLAMARQDNEDAIKRLKFCRNKGIWPTGYEEVRLLDVA